LSYRLIFGQDERSYKAFSRMVPLWEEQRGRSSWETNWDCDPMLHVICGQSSNDEEARNIYDDIDANEPASYYNPHTEFPFFGKRLLELQHFIKQHQPQTVRSLLNDRRDISAWYSLWNNQVYPETNSYSEEVCLRMTGAHLFCNYHDLPHGSILGLSSLASDTC
jgi:hypothetical protein